MGNVLFLELYHKLSHCITFWGQVLILELDNKSHMIHIATTQEENLIYFYYLEEAQASWERRCKPCKREEVFHDLKVKIKEKATILKK